MKVGQEVFFVREKPPRIYNYNKPEVAVIVKIGKTIIHAKVLTTGTIHRFNMKTLKDASYTFHRLFLSYDELENEQESQTST